ncbi:valine--tRNA ligase [Helicobacter aurati]|uniref:Valine--tRNA ligase n=1 Tax=Helicobacter aurati TaxID=137778 RepID=A0A3D8J5Z6_9HELI|nr:valine--tRNA ligase [Helicobacter aurati]RDU72927.1 valine--tRNA ligase [Helicobacter aurati]
MSDKSLFTTDWESLIYRECEKRGYFETNGNKALQQTKQARNTLKAQDSISSNTFCIMMPPPNVTGVLHIGHALTFTLQDIIVRYKRMDGFEVLWQPGLDHAGIATQNIVEKQLLAQGIKKEDIGREEFIKKVWEWKQQSGGKILEQMRAMGFSPAFKRTRFTMDKGLANAVRQTFSAWYQKGAIYRGERMINWCTHDGALSDIEVEYQDNVGKLYYLRYFLADSHDSYIVVATTRPETYFGDSALMVHPEDSRYKHLIGKKVRLPLMNTEIPIIADSIVDTEFGTGAVKVTPAHDMNDYEVGLRHGLAQIVVFDTKGILNAQCGEFEGLERLQAREKIIEKLQQEGFIEKVEEYHNKLGICYRCGNVIEPYISKQWFVKAEIAKGAMERVAKSEARFYPAQWKNNYDAWMRDLRDWCISRQLWWGHRIPIFYCECGNEFINQDSESATAVCPKCGSTKTEQDSDVLDTWFSSALWSHSTLGFGNGDFGKGELWHEEDLEKFHPNSLLITGFDILFFWVARMLLAADSNMQQIAFKDIYLHALVLDSKGQKMSKSKGNIIDPLELCKKYNPDIVRFSLAFLCIQGRDIRLSEKQLEITRNFTNKIINAMKFLQLYAEQLNPHYAFIQRDSLNDYQSPLGIYMKSRLNFAILESRNALDSYRFDSYASILYRFLWNEFCDIGIEYAKADKQSVFELASILIESMKLLHPLMPFLSEYVFHTLLGRDIANGLGEHNSIMIESFPYESKRAIGYEQAFEIIADCITTIRRMRITLDIANQELESVFIQPHKNFKQNNDDKIQGKELLSSQISLQELGLRFITKLAKIKRVFLVDYKPEKCIADIGNYAQIFIESKKLDLKGIQARLAQQEAKIEKEVAKLQSILSNENFLRNAPQEVVENNQNALRELEQKRNAILREKNVLLQQL